MIWQLLSMQENNMLPCNLRGCANSSTTKGDLILDVAVIIKNCAVVAHSVERMLHTHEVAGSMPASRRDSLLPPPTVQRWEVGLGWRLGGDGTGRDGLRFPEPAFFLLPRPSSLLQPRFLDFRLGVAWNCMRRRSCVVVGCWVAVPGVAGLGLGT
jgi:hypothetical protein